LAVWVLQGDEVRPLDALAAVWPAPTGWHAPIRRCRWRWLEVAAADR